MRNPIPFFLFRPILCVPLCFLIFLAFSLNAQNNSYFPPVQGTEWDTLHPEELNWCADSLLSLHAFLESTQTKAFIILKGGKRVYETYFDAFTQDSFWYWASAGKTLTAFLIGKAAEEGVVDIHKPSSHYLGVGWTAMDSAQESLITPFHQLTMTTGLDFTNPNANCTTPECLQYRSDPGSEWYYYNAPYLLLQDVIEAATNRSMNTYTFTTLAQQTGITGFWNNQGVFFSRPRSMARFGILIANKGFWNGNTVLHDTSYLNAMVSPSQTLNPSYGYLWWLNGQPSYRLPVLTQLFTGPLTPEAPSDMFSAKGRDNQRLYIVPSQDLIVVRMGNPDTEIPALGPSGFDNLLWKKLQNLECKPTHIGNPNTTRSNVYVFPNPGFGNYTIEGNNPVIQYTIKNAVGQHVIQGVGNEFNLSLYESGIYYVHILLENNRVKICKIAHTP